MTQKTINNNDFNSKRLSVQISLNGLSFLISDANGIPLLFNENKLNHSTTPEEIQMELQLFFSENNIWEIAFSEVSIIYATDIFSLVPKELFDESKASEYLKFNSKILANDYIAFDQLANRDILVVYVPLVNINNLFFEKYGSFNYYHTTTILLNSIFQSPIPDLPRIYLHFNSNSFECIIFKNGELQLCNNYSFHTPEDFIYYTLFAMEQLKLDPETVPVYLCGNIKEDDKIYKIAYRYIRNIEFLKAEKSFKSKYPEIPDHQHFLIKNI